MITGLLDGFLSNLYSVVYDSGELLSAQTTISITGLHGDTDEEYLLIVRGVSGAASNTFNLRINDDTGSNYGAQHVRGESASVIGGRTVDNKIILEWQGMGSGHLGFSQTRIIAKTGTARLVAQQCVNQINGMTITDYRIAEWSWNNSNDEITSLTVYAQQTNGFGIGSRVILMKKNALTGGTKAGTLDIRGIAQNTFQLIETKVVTTPVQSVVFSGLDGDNDVLYRLVSYIVSGVNTVMSFVMRMNGDTGANYGNQSFRAGSTTLAASRGTGITYVTIGGTQVIATVSLGRTLLYAKSGFPRALIAKFSNGVNGSSIFQLWDYAGVWNNTVSNITSLTIDSLNAGGLAVGSQLSLFRLNLRNP
jgi:hypothetical protein